MNEINTGNDLLSAMDWIVSPQIHVEVWFPSSSECDFRDGAFTVAIKL